jgi:predicted dienelactone hydrolase
VEERLLVWRDAARARDIPLKRYLPAGAVRPPVVLFSTGLGADRGHYAYLGRHWAGRGYAVFVIQHPGSDAAIFSEPQSDPFWAVMRAALRKRNWTDRPLDVGFLIDRIAAGEGGLALDAERIGVAGHSFGAYTALATAGLRVELPGAGGRGFGDARVRAVVEMSFPGDMGGALGPGAFEAVRAPCLHLAGTRDDTPMLGAWAADRRIPFDRITGAEQYLVTIAGADHFALADNERGLDGRPVRRNPAVHRTACLITAAFWDAHLRGDASARDWLRRVDLAGLTRGLCRMETRTPGDAAARDGRGAPLP